MEREPRSNLEKFRILGDVFSIGLLAFGFTTAILDLAISQTIVKEITKKAKNRKK